MHSVEMVLGGLALATSAGALCLRDDRLLRRVHLVGMCLWGGYFAVLGQWSAVISFGIAVCIVSASLFGFKRMTLAMVLAEAGFAGWFLVASGWLSALPLVTGVILNASIALFSGTRLTLSNLFGQSIWCVYTIATGSWFSTAATAAAMMALLVRLASTRPAVVTA